MDNTPADPWRYSDQDGYRTEDGSVRIYGFDAPPEKQLGKGRVASRRPAVVDLEPGLYTWCACGRSGKQPFCDGSHEDRDNESGRSGYRFRVLRQTRLKLCRCKNTPNPPFCECPSKQQNNSAAGTE